MWEGCGALTAELTAWVAGGGKLRGRPGEITAPGRCRARDRQTCWNLLLRPHPQRPLPRRVSSTPTATPRGALPARLLRRRGLWAAGPAPFENGSISGYSAFKGVFLKELVGKDKSGRPHSADQSKTLNGDIKRRPN